MNTRETLRALMDGKMVVDTRYPKSPIRLTDDRLETLTVHGRWVKVTTFVYGGTYELYQEPNPHPKGSYAWAKEEHRRGHDVTNDLVEGDPYPHTMSWGRTLMYADEFETMSWRRA